MEILLMLSLKRAEFNGTVRNITFALIHDKYAFKTIVGDLFCDRIGKKGIAQAIHVGLRTGSAFPKKNLK